MKTGLLLAIAVLLAARGTHSVVDFKVGALNDALIVRLLERSDTQRYVRKPGGSAEIGTNPSPSNATALLGEAGAATSSAAQAATAPPRQRMALVSRAQARRLLENVLAMATADPGMLAFPPRGGRVLKALTSIAENAAAIANEPHGGAVTEHIEELRELLGRLPVTGGWPAVRRVIVAALALRRLRHEPLSAAAEVAAAQMLLRLFGMHVAAAKRKRVVEFTHVSKSGGTSFCQLGEVNGCMTESFNASRNCLIPTFDDRPRYIDAGYHRKQRPLDVKTPCDHPLKAMGRRHKEIGCKRRRGVLIRRGYSIYATEYTAVGGRSNETQAHHCNNMLTVLQLRHPYERIASHIAHTWHRYGAHCNTSRDTVYFASGTNATHWAHLMPAAMDCYLIRSLLGERVYNLHSGGVTRDHADLARRIMLQQYDVLLVLEDSDMSHLAYRYGLGWRQVSMHSNAARWPTSAGMPADMGPLYTLNELDMDLYKFGVVLAAIDAVVHDVARALTKDDSANATAGAATGPGAAAVGAATGFAAGDAAAAAPARAGVQAVGEQAAAEAAAVASGDGGAAAASEEAAEWADEEGVEAGDGEEEDGEDEEEEEEDLDAPVVEESGRDERGDSGADDYGDVSSGGGGGGGGGEAGGGGAGGAAGGAGGRRRASQHHRRRRGRALLAEASSGGGLWGPGRTDGAREEGSGGGVAEGLRRLRQAAGELSAQLQGQGEAGVDGQAEEGQGDGEQARAKQWRVRSRLPGCGYVGA
ncbi:hypothetical protein HYH03_015862 [Edaphochlamys debaryana]|uniref:Uncharacterized protein n=1 Tax=Edaphochlamys debaryana TaxID=47281 RepID=A0A835XK79_9CHLO|nr:hypothetical protein HYH03_015862 [Edaphochlamys debaryana]|eukprot:KAG2485371.1 hypothetical protein HYH03_015862 [Edaphochlamys debaryana]